jgi:hypothetical protein
MNNFLLTPKRGTLQAYEQEKYENILGFVSLRLFMDNDGSYTVFLLVMSPSLHTSIQFKHYLFSELTTLNSPMYYN